MPNLKHLLDDLEELDVAPEKVRIPVRSTTTWLLMPRNPSR